MAPLQRVRLQKCFRWVCRVLGSIILAAAGLAAASPVVLVLLFLLAVLLSSVFLWLGALAGLAAIAAFILHCLVGLPFWFWMIFTGFGVLVFGVGLVGSVLSGNGDIAGAVRPRDGCMPLTWLLAALLFADWWGERTNG